AEAIEAMKTRTALENALYEVWNDFRWYLRRTAPHQPTLRKAIKIWIRLLAPFIPHLCEELWETLGEKGFVAQASWPSREEAPENLEAEELEAMLKELLEDTKHILRVTRVKPRKVYYYVPAEWKWKVYLEALSKGKEQARELIKTFAPSPEVAGSGKQAVRLLVRLVEGATRLDRQLAERRLRVGRVDDEGFLREVKGFLERELNAEVEVLREGSPSLYDPKGKASQAEPYRPAIYIE
ncbi:MAG: leucine--tRNA ligase, partial [Candidatus Hecatellales archaeon]